MGFDPNYHSQVKAMIADLDNSEPRWFLDWADGTDLRDQCVNILEGMSQEGAIDRTKKRLANRLFNRVIMAGVAAGVVVLKSATFVVLQKDSEGTTQQLFTFPSLEAATAWVKKDLFVTCALEPEQVEEFDHDLEDPTNTIRIVKQWVTGDTESYEIYVR